MGDSLQSCLPEAPCPTCRKLHTRVSSPPITLTLLTLGKGLLNLLCFYFPSLVNCINFLSFVDCMSFMGHINHMNFPSLVSFLRFLRVCSLSPPSRREYFNLEETIHNKESHTPCFPSSIFSFTDLADFSYSLAL